MGRKKIEIEKIIDKDRRKVTFSKRRKGLFKMMKDIASKHDVEIASIVFSESGRAYTFGSHQVDATIGKFMKDSGLTVSTGHRQEVKEHGTYEAVQALIEEAKKCLSKGDNELTGLDELIKHRADLQILKDKLVEISKRCYSKRETDLVEIPDSARKEPEYKLAEPAGHEMLQTRSEADICQSSNPYYQELVCEGQEMVPPEKGWSLAIRCTEDASVSATVGCSSLDNYWTEHYQEGLFHKEVSAIVRGMSWHEVFGRSWTGLRSGSSI